MAELKRELETDRTLTAKPQGSTDWEHANSEWGIQFALEAIRCAFLANAGAAVALLAFAASVLAGDGLNKSLIETSGLRFALVLFVVGVAMSTFAFAAGWIAQRLFSVRRFDAGTLATICGMCLTLGACALFIWGCREAAASIFTTAPSSASWTELACNLLGKLKNLSIRD